MGGKGALGFGVVRTVVVVDCNVIRRTLRKIILENKINSQGANMVVLQSHHPFSLELAYREEASM